jgi:hypothetical protein
MTAAKPKSRTRKIPPAVTPNILTGQALLDDMQAYRKKVASSKKTATKFLQQMGVLTSNGKAKRLIRG